MRLFANVSRYGAQLLKKKIHYLWCYNLILIVEMYFYVHVLVKSNLFNFFVDLLLYYLFWCNMQFVSVSIVVFYWRICYLFM